MSFPFKYVFLSDFYNFKKSDINLKAIHTYAVLSFHITGALGEILECLFLYLATNWLGSLPTSHTHFLEGRMKPFIKRKMELHVVHGHTPKELPVLWPNWGDGPCHLKINLDSLIIKSCFGSHANFHIPFSFQLPLNLLFLQSPVHLLFQRLEHELDQE